MPGIIWGMDCLGDTNHECIELKVYCEGKDNNWNNYIYENLHQTLKCHETLKQKTT